MIKIDRNDIKNLQSLQSRTESMILAVKRKRKIRVAEKAMWLVELNGQLETVRKLLNFYNNAMRFDIKGNPVEPLRD